MSSPPLASSTPRSLVNEKMVLVDEKGNDYTNVIEAGGRSPVCEAVDSGSGVERYEFDAIVEKRLIRKCDLHVIPVLFVLYVFAFLDRINIGNAKIQGLTADLNMTGTQYNVALQVFFIPYILLEVPSNIVLRKVAPSTWLTGLLFCWGVVSMCQGLVSSYAGLVVCRFFLGIFEAGVFPGAAYLISMYYKRHELQQRWIWFFSSGLVAGAFGGFLAYALIKMNGLGGYAGWRWIFIIEGLATIAFACFTKFLIPDWPETASFLNIEEKALLRKRLDHDFGSGSARMDRLDRATFWRIMRDWKIWVGTLMYLGLAVSGYSSAFFIPTILNDFGYSPSDAQVHTIPVYVVCTVITLVAAYVSDHLRHRYLFTMGGVVVASVGYIMLLCQGPTNGGMPIGARYAAVFFVLGGLYVTQPMAIVWLANNIGGHYKRSFGTAIQIGLGNIGGIIGSNIYIQAEAPAFTTGYSTALAFLWFSALMCTIFYFGMMAENRKRDRGERDDRLACADTDNLGDDHPEFRFAG